jgi:hypothetical protein
MSNKAKYFYHLPASSPTRPTATTTRSVPAIQNWATKLTDPDKYQENTCGQTHRRNNDRCLYGKHRDEQSSIVFLDR